MVLEALTDFGNTSGSVTSSNMLYNLNSKQKKLKGEFASDVAVVVFLLMSITNTTPHIARYSTKNHVFSELEHEVMYLIMLKNILKSHL